LFVNLALVNIAAKRLRAKPCNVLLCEDLRAGAGSLSYIVHVDCCSLSTIVIKMMMIIIIKKILMVMIVMSDSDVTVI